MVELVIRRPTVWLPVWALFQSFPLALFTGALVSDIAYANTAQIQWSNFSSWMIAGGLLMSGLAMAAAALAALMHWRSLRWRRAAVFGIGSIATFAVGLLNSFVHAQDAWTSVVPLGLTLSVIVFVLILVTSWIGYHDMANRAVTP